MMGRADIDGSNNNVAMNACLPQTSSACGMFVALVAEHFSDLRIDLPRLHNLYLYGKSKSSEHFPFWFT